MWKQHDDGDDDDDDDDKPIKLALHFSSSSLVQGEGHMTHPILRFPYRPWTLAIFFCFHPFIPDKNWSYLTWLPPVWSLALNIRVINLLSHLWRVGLDSMRQDVFDNLLVAEKLKDGLKPEAKRYLEKLIKLGRRNGKARSLHFKDSICSPVCSKISNLITLTYSWMSSKLFAQKSRGNDI